MVKLIFTAGLLACLISPARAQGKKKLFLPTGTQLRSTITNAIFSYNLATPVIAELEEGALFLNRIVLPPKTRLLGRALVLKSHDRVNVEFDMAVLPDGREIAISGMALSPDGSGGLKGRVDRYKDSAVASAALKSVVLGATAMATSGVNPIAAQTGQAAADEAVKDIDLSHEQVDTSISIPAFTRCLIYLSRRVEF